jgi:hypothetical protein
VPPSAPSWLYMHTEGRPEGTEPKGRGGKQTPSPRTTAPVRPPTASRPPFSSVKTPGRPPRPRPPSIGRPVTTSPGLSSRGPSNGR